MGSQSRNHLAMDAQSRQADALERIARALERLANKFAAAGTVMPPDLYEPSDEPPEDYVDAE